jgi:predicted membrane channel-forming protein YqfA (hemolysin III family)
MHIQKRAINPDTNDDYGQKSSIPIERKTHKCWRRFMNERAIDRAYVPTTHGILFFFYDTNSYLYHLCVYIEHVANCLTHGCLIIPSLIAGQRLIYHAKTPAQYWSSIIYGNALIFLFSFSTVFHCSCFHPTYRYK